MAIGSAPEIGTEFRLGVIVTQGVSKHGIDLLDGYATLHYPPRFPSGSRPICPLIEEQIETFLLHRVEPVAV